MENDESNAGVEDTGVAEDGLLPNDPNGESTTPEEVAQLLGLESPKPDEGAGADKDDETGDEGADASADDGGDDADAEDEADEENDAEDQDSPTSTEVNTDEKQFTLEVEDANGTKFTLQPGDDLEKALADFEPKNNGQIFKVLQDLQKLETAKAEYDKEQETQAAESEKQQRIESIRGNWDKEIESLQGDKRLPVEADGKTSERVKEVFNFMSKENEKRVAAGRPLLESFEDALDKLELKESKDEADKKDKEERELAKRKGAMVGGSSAPASSGAPTYKGGARNANEALRSLGLLR